MSPFEGSKGQDDKAYQGMGRVGWGGRLFQGRFLFFFSSRKVSRVKEVLDGGRSSG